MSSGTKFRCGLDVAHPRACSTPLSQKAHHIGLFGNTVTQKLSLSSSVKVFQLLDHSRVLRSSPNSSYDSTGRYLLKARNLATSRSNT